MKIVPISFKILGLFDDTEFNEVDGEWLLNRIEQMGRISHRSEDKKTHDSYDRFLRSVILNHGDWSIAEHASVTVEAEVDRGITHEIVRHRIAAYTQESTRFVNYGKKEDGLRFIKPDDLFGQNETRIWENAMKTAEDSYLALLMLGKTPQIARSVLPNALASKIAMTYNLRTWRHFFIMRTSRESHPQMKQLTIPLLAEFKRVIPILYEDIEPEMKQSEAMRLLR